MDLEASGNRLDTDGVKLYCTTMGKNVADRAIQVMGGYGYMGEYAVERLWPRRRPEAAPVSGPPPRGAGSERAAG